MKKTDRIISFILSAIMVVTTFLAVGPVFSINAEAAITINSVTQPDIDISQYESNRKNFFGGESTNWPTEFVLPGLDYPLTPQSVTYWAKRDWVLVSARNTQGSSHYVLALDAKSADFVALFKIWGPKGVYDYLACDDFSIAASEHNLYLISSRSSSISYFPLSEMDISLSTNASLNRKDIGITASINLGAEINNARLAYCSVDDGVLWVGNCYGNTYPTKAYNDTYPSALMGYQLKGSSSAQEWNNLKAESASDCAGNPTYCILFKNNLTNIQHASVNNGKLYILRSDSQLVSSSTVSSFDMADIDINVPGSTRLEINGKTKDCYIIGDSLTSYSGSKIPANGEAFCVIDNYLYMLGIQASGASASTAPIQVLWKVDHLKLGGITRPNIDDDVKASHYEKVYNLNSITGDDEYIITYKSANKDPVTQQEIYYLLDSFGGYGGKKLPKNNAPDGNGKNIGDSFSIIGYAMGDYTADGDKLYINDTVDERKSVRWKISHSGGSNLRLENMDFYYGNYKYLVTHYHDVAMMSDASTYMNSMRLTATGNGTFRISFGNYYLWCNDNEYPGITDIYTNYYQTNKPVDYTPNYSGLTEVAGTFHTDGEYNYGSLGGNKTGAAVNSKLMEFEIYKRVKDPYATSGEEKIRTEYDVSLNENGLYDITIGSYATSSINYYKKLPDNTDRPTDFIFVMDASRSMRYAYKEFSGATKNFNIGWLLSQSDYNTINSKSVGSYMMDLTADQDEYYKAADGTYHELKLAIRKTETTPRFMFWLYYEKDNQYYIINNNGSLKSSSPWSRAKFIEYLQYGVSENTDSNARLYTDCSSGNYSNVSGGSFKNVPHYVIVNSSGEGDNGRIGVARDLIKQMIDRISANNSNHRIAFCQFTGTPGQNTGNNNATGEYTGFFTTSSTNRTTIPHGYIDCDGYEKAFHNAGNSSHITNLKNILSKFDYGTNNDGCGNGGGSDLSYGMHMAHKMLTESGNDYSYYGDRHACVIVLTDGGVTVDDSQTNLTHSSSAATSAIMIASKIKNLGASVYTIRIGEEKITDLDTANVLNSISSNRIDASSISNSGEANPAGENYTFNLKLDNYDSSYTSFYFYDGFLNHVRSYEHHTVAKLGTDAVIREKFDTNVFSYIDGVSSVSAQKIKAYYDALGRLSFDYNSAESLSTPSLDRNSGQITANGFDYSKHCVGTATATRDGTARKFVITIKNVALNEKSINKTNPNADYINAQVDVNSNVGIYRDPDSYNTGNVYKGFPSDRIKIPQYTYVADYGLPMSDPHVNGTVIAVDTQLRQQTSPSPYLPNETNIGVNGMFAGASGNTELLYSVRPAADGNTEAYTLIRRPGGNYDWFKLNIIPASNVYFEENAFSTTKTANTDWTSGGTTVSSSQDLTSADDVYGKDSSYESSTASYSNGTCYSVTVSAASNRSETLSTTFVGTGFELYGTCGADTGVQVIAVRDKDGKLVKSAVVDTFYKDTQSYGALYQAPVYNVSGLSYGTYTVEVTAAYLPSISGAVQQAHLEDIPSSVKPELAGALVELGFEEILTADDVDVEWFDDDSVLNGGTGAYDPEEFSTQAVTSLVNYVDAIRIFEPAADGDKYYIESEKNARYYNINDNLMSASDYITGGSGFVYVEGNGEYGFSATDYNKKGSKHELYLSSKSQNDNALTFKVSDYGENARVMLSLRAAYGTPLVKIGSHSLTITSKTDMYYDITDFIAADGTVTIENATDGTLLSVGYVKVTGEASLQATSDLSTTIDMIEIPLDGDVTASSSVTKLEYTPAVDSHNSFNVTVNGRPTMIQFIEEDGGTRTYDRNNKNVVIRSYNADGVEVNSLDRTVAYEVWTISTNLTGPEVKVRAKYIEDGAYKWEKEMYSFTYEILEPVVDADVRSITPAATSGKKGAVEVKVVTGPDAQGVRFVMPDGSTCTYYAAKAVTLENGDLEFTGKAWMNEDGVNEIQVYVRKSNTWICAAEISYTAE